MKDSSNVMVTSYKGYWHLYRRVNGVDYLGHSDHRIGLSISTPNDLEENFKIRDPKRWVSFENKEGELIQYWDEPYTESQVESFAKLTEEELKEWVRKSQS